MCRVIAKFKKIRVRNIKIIKSRVRCERGNINFGQFLRRVRTEVSVVDFRKIRFARHTLFIKNKVARANKFVCIEIVKHTTFLIVGGTQINTSKSFRMSLQGIFIKDISLTTEDAKVEKIDRSPVRIENVPSSYRSRKI